MSKTVYLKNGDCVVIRNDGVNFCIDLEKTDSFPRFLCEKLYKRHIDLDNLIDKGLAVNGNEIK